MHIAKLTIKHRDPFWSRQPYGVGLALGSMVWIWPDSAVQMIASGEYRLEGTPTKRALAPVEEAMSRVHE